MDFKHVDAFLQVAATLHFGRAAIALHITQSALTQRIQALERELGVQLLNRGPSGVRLTAAGEVLLPYARTLVQTVSLAERDLADNAAGLGGHLRLGYLAHGDLVAQVKIANEFRREYPRITVETSSASSQDNLERVANGELEAAFATSPIQPRSGVMEKVILVDPLVVVLPKSHRLAHLDPVPVARLRGESLIITPARLNITTVAAFRAWLERLTGAPLKVIAEEPPVQAVEAVAALGGPLAFVSGRLSTSMAASNVVFRTLSPAPVLKLVLIYLRDNPAPILTSLLRTVDEVAPSLQVDVPTDSESL